MPGMKTRLLLIAALTIGAAPLLAQTPPGLSAAGQEAYRDYLKARNHRAFAIAPGGVWAWRAGADSPDQAEDGALADCRTSTRQKCALYASDEQKVFNAAAWTAQWGPYATAAVAARAAVGKLPGQRFPDLAYRDRQGRAGHVAALRGKLLILHFWASWCPPCRREMPEIAQLYKKLADRRDIVFLPLQVRETFAVSSQWLSRQELDLPLVDSGSLGEGDESLRLADKTVLPDREIARSFPTTYVLDKHGLVLFSQTGPLADWAAYEGLLRHAAANSGK